MVWDLQPQCWCENWSTKILLEILLGFTIGESFHKRGSWGGLGSQDGKGLKKCFHPIKIHEVESNRIDSCLGNSPFEFRCRLYKNYSSIIAMKFLKPAFFAFQTSLRDNGKLNFNHFQPVHSSDHHRRRHHYHTFGPCLNTGSQCMLWRLKGFPS